MRILDLMIKDLYQIARDWKAAFFLVAMPIAFTLLLGFAFSGGGEGDPRLPVGVLNLDGEDALSVALLSKLDSSTVMRLVTDVGEDEAALAEQVADEDLAAAVIVPAGYGRALRGEEALSLRVIADETTNARLVAKNEVQRVLSRWYRAVAAARLSAKALMMADESQYGSSAAQQRIFEESLNQALLAWETPPITLAHAASGQPASGQPASGQPASEDTERESSNAFTHSSAGIMVQFAIAGLIGAAEVIVLERKSRTLQRMLTTAISKAGIITGHFLAIYVMVLVQLVILVLFGQLLLDVGYFTAPLATLVMVLTMAFFTAALGMLIGAISRTEEHTIIYSMVLMMVLSGMGGAWMPLEETNETFRTIGHFLPTAWAIDGLKNITVRGQGLASVILPAAILVGFGIACFLAAIVLFRTD